VTALQSMRSAIQAAANPNQDMCAVHVVVSCTTSMIARLLKQLAHEEGEEATERKDSPKKRYNVSVYPSIRTALLTQAYAADECWFCLSNPNLAKHLIVAVGGECYLTLPKGQLIPTHGPDATAKKGISLVPGGGHLLIVPIAHFPTLASISSDTSISVMDEIER
jgi:hypothetical protein